MKTTKVILNSHGEGHTHYGVVCHAGDEIEVTESEREFLERLGKIEGKSSKKASAAKESSGE